MPAPPEAHVRALDQRALEAVRKKGARSPEMILDCLRLMGYTRKKAKELSGHVE